MQLPRFKLAWLMAFIALAALNFGAIRALKGYRPNEHTGEALFVGALPMANVLAVVLLACRRRRGCRRFLSGFEAFGAMALALYVALAILPTGGLLQSYLDLAIHPIREAVGRRRLIPFRILIPAYSALALWASLPQLALALVGGFLSVKYTHLVNGRNSRSQGGKTGGPEFLP